MAESTIEPGRILADKYRLESLLGKGGMGQVWRADHLTLDAPVAVKLMDASIAEDEEALARFLREARAAAALRSPNVVQILDHGVDDGMPFIVMELLEGVPLSRLLKQGPLPPARLAKVFSDVARAVSRAHKNGVIHRDLKPDNIFLVSNEDEEIAKVLDFGVAKTTDLGVSAGARTRTGALLGTPFYMSPEQASAEAVVDSRSDLWALGVIAYECVTGQRPFRAERLLALIAQIASDPLPVPSDVAEVPEGFNEWFARAVSRDPDERFQSAAQMARTLREVLRGTGADIASIDDSGSRDSLADSDTVRDPSSPSLARAANAPTEPVGDLGLTTGGSTNAEVTQRRSPRSRATLWGALGLGVVAIGGWALGIGRSERTEDVVMPSEPAAQPPTTSSNEPMPATTPSVRLDEGAAAAEAPDEAAVAPHRNDDAGAKSAPGGGTPTAEAPARPAPAPPRVAPRPTAPRPAAAPAPKPTPSGSKPKVNLGI